MATPTPRLTPDSPLQVVTARTLFDTAPVGRRNAASVVRIESTGRLLMCFSHVVGPALRNQAALVVSHSDDDGETWSDPETVYAYPGWFSLAMGGLARVADDNVKMILGRMRIDLSLGGTEPMTGWWVASSTTRDGGDSWSEPSPEIRLFPHWTELYGASNPHPLADGRLLWATMGTDGSRHRLARRRERQRRRRRALRAADDHRPGRRPRLQRHRRDPAGRRPLPGGRPRTQDPPERLLDLRGRGRDLVAHPPDRVQGLEHQAVPIALRPGGLRLSRRGSRRSAASASA